MTIRGGVGAVGLVLCTVLSLGAEEGKAPAAPLTWSDCVSLALKSNPDLASSRAAKESGAYAYRGSFNALMPGLTLSNSYSDSGPKTALKPAPWEADASLNMDVLNLSNVADVRASAASLSGAEAALREASASLYFNLRQAFVQALFSQKSVEVSKSILAMRRQSAQLVVLRYNSGRESKGNMLRAKAQLLQATADLAQALRNTRVAQKALDRQLGFDAFELVPATGTLSAGEPPELPRDEASLLSRRPDVAVQEAAVKAAEAAMSRSKSALWPVLSANYSRFRSGSREFPSDSSGWSAGGVLSYPLFAGGPTAAVYSIAAAGRNLEKSKQDLRSAREQAVVDIETSWSSFASAADQFKVQTALLEAARQRNDEADVQYASGLITYDDWEIISSDRVNQERQAIQSQLNAAVAEAAWQKSLGRQLEE